MGSEMCIRDSTCSVSLSCDGIKQVKCASALFCMTQCVHGQDLDQEGMFCFKLLDSGRTWAQVRGETQTCEIPKQQVMCEAREIPILNREGMFRFKLLDTGPT